MTVNDAIDSYLVMRLERGDKPRSVATTERRLRPLLARVENALLLEVDHAVAFELATQYRDSSRVGERSNDSVRNALNECRTFWNYAIEEGWTAENPWERRDPRFKNKQLARWLDRLPRAKRGKPQLKLWEARKFVDVCIYAAEKDPRGPALPAILCLLQGLRASEAHGLRRRAVDDGGRLVWVEDAKTEAGERIVECDEGVAGLLDKACAGLPAEAPLFPGVTNSSLRHYVIGVCVRAGITEVTPHGLRRTHMTLARGAGVTGAAVAASVGHTRYSTSQRHYVEPGTDERLAAARVGGLLSR